MPQVGECGDEEPADGLLQDDLVGEGTDAEEEGEAGVHAQRLHVYTVHVQLMFEK